jgi:hypothetical protein
MTITLPGASAADLVPSRRLVQIWLRNLYGLAVSESLPLPFPSSSPPQFDSTRQPLPIRDPANFAGPALRAHVAKLIHVQVVDSNEESHLEGTARHEDMFGPTNATVSV